MNNFIITLQCRKHFSKRFLIKISYLYLKKNNKTIITKLELFYPHTKSHRDPLSILIASIFLPIPKHIEIPLSFTTQQKTIQLIMIASLLVNHMTLKSKTSWLEVHMSLKSKTSWLEVHMTLKSKN